MRLLVLYPAQNHVPLVCTLKTVSLKEKPIYAALSYCWGTDPPQANVYLLPPEFGETYSSLSGREVAKYSFHIQNNLFRALLQLRKGSCESVVLWVDAVCIDQNNPVEKTQQLGKMVDIYHMAKNVCIWLGESDDDGRSDSAMEFIPKIMDLAVLDRYANDKKQAKQWAAVAELMRDRWFSRRWVVQEISLARSATVHCGKKVVQWVDFADAVSLLVANRESIRNLFDFAEWRHGPNTLGEVQSFGGNVLLEATSNLFLRTEDGSIVEPLKNLESLVTSLKTFDASNPRDIIYGLLSIAVDTFRPSMSYQTRRNKNRKERVVKLEVDYRKDAIKVYKDFTEFCVKSSGSLDIICRHWAIPVEMERPMLEGGRGKEYRKLPSWIPLLSDSEFGSPNKVYRGCWKTSPQQYHVIRLVGDISWQEFNQSDNFDHRSKFLEISLTTYIENKQYIEFLAL